MAPSRPLPTVEQSTALPSFRDRETFSLSSAPSFASMGRMLVRLFVILSFRVIYSLPIEGEGWGEGLSLCTPRSICDLRGLVRK